MSSFTFTVTITTDTAAHARTVMAERLAHDEDYGFDYQLGWEPAE